MSINTAGKTPEEILAEVVKEHPELSATQQLVMATGLIGTHTDRNGRINAPRVPKLGDIKHGLDDDT